MAALSSRVPAAGVYFVKPCSIAACPAALMCAGVSKSGSPAPNSTTSTPCALSLSASTSTFIVGDADTRLIRSASISISPAGAAPGMRSWASGQSRDPRQEFRLSVLARSRGCALLVQSPLDSRRNQPADRSAQHHDLLDQSRADVTVLGCGHHENRFDPGIQTPVHEGHLEL